MLETIKERHIDLILMGWKGNTATPGRVFGSAVDTIVRQAACDVVVIKLSKATTFDHWLVPIAGGPNSQQALRLLPALTTLSPSPTVEICQVFNSMDSAEDNVLLHQAVDQLSSQVHYPVVACPAWGPSVSEAILHLAVRDACDVIVLGASREGLLQQAIKGNIPEAIARYGDRTIILVRGAIATES